MLRYLRHQIFNMWTHRMLDGNPKTKTEEKVLNAYYKSITKKAQVGPVPEMRRSPATLSRQGRRELVPRLRSDPGRELEKENSKGGHKRKEMKDKPTLGKLLIELIRLKSVFQTEADGHRNAGKRAHTLYAHDRHMGQADAYTDV